jgi:autotransporter-associated beta strand protein
MAVWSRSARATKTLSGRHVPCPFCGGRDRFRFDDKNGAGTWIPAGANTYPGGTTVNAGILRLGHLSALGSGPVNLAGGTLDLAGLAFAGEITLGGGLLANAANWTGAAVITSTTSAPEINALTQSTVSVRTGTVSLAGVNKDVLLSGGVVSNLATFGGALVASGGTVDLSAGDFAGTLGLSGGTADFGATVSSRAISYASGAVTGAAYTGDIVVNGANVALGASLAAGTVVLTADNSATLQAGFTRDIRFEGGALANFGNYTGLITVAGGATFDLDGDSLLPFETAARFSLASGSRLKGTGTVGGLSVLAGGILAPGNSPGRLIVEGDLDLAATAVFEVEILTATGALGEPQAGDDYDTIDVTGLLDLSQLTPTERFVITLISLADPTTAGPLFDFDPAQAYTFTLFTYGELDLGANAALADLFIIDTSAFRDLGNNTVAAERFSLFDTGSSIVLTYSAIPEPSTYGLALGALALAGAAYRRRARRHGGTAAQGPKLAR